MSRSGNTGSCGGICIKRSTASDSAKATGNSSIATIGFYVRKLRGKRQCTVEERYLKVLEFHESGFNSYRWTSGTQEVRISALVPQKPHTIKQSPKFQTLRG